MHRIDTRSTPIEYWESGSGAPVLFIPGSYSTPAAWRPIQRLLPQRWRLIGTSLCGYGQTAESRTLADFGMAHELRVVEHAASRAGGPVHLVGHSFGATVALAYAMSGSVPVASLALFEPNPMTLLRGGPHQALFEEAERVSRAFAEAVRRGEPDAPARIIDFWGGEGAFAAMPAGVQDYCRSTAPANVLDWHTDFGFDAAIERYAMLDVPVLLVRGALSNAAMVAMTDVLAQALPRARPAVVAGASHFLVNTHAPACAELLGGFLPAVT